MPRESVARSFYTVLILALVCSLLVSGAAVGLRHRQEVNKQHDRKKNILRAAGLYQENVPVAQLFSAIEPRTVELTTGRMVSGNEVSGGGRLDQRNALKSQGVTTALSRDEDIAGIGPLEKYATVYLVREKGGVTQVVLPIRGKGLWSTMYGYVSLAPDLSTIRGITFYEHGETPGLGGEIEDPRWLSGWSGKKIFNEAAQLVIRVVKGDVQGADPGSQYLIDGLSGATLTGNGVNNLLKFWFGEHGFKPFLDRFAQEIEAERG